LTRSAPPKRGQVSLLLPHDGEGCQNIMKAVQGAGV
jgi:hypothetical protein